MKRFAPTSFAAGAIVASALTALPATAAVLAAADQAPTRFDGTTPALTVQPLRFVVGGVIDATTGRGGCDVEPSIHRSIPMDLRWAASDTVSGLAAYDVYTSAPFEILRIPNTQQTSLRVLGRDAISPCGGGDSVTRYRIVAKDNRGNFASSNKSATNFVHVAQEDGTSVWEGPLFPVVRSGSWLVSPCACSDAGRTWFSATAGASLTYAVQSAAGGTVGLVVGKNTNRGRAAISVDGGAPATVDTFATSPQNRVIVWQATLTARAHTVKVTNLGTAGRPRVDVDALLLTTGQ